MTIQGSRSLNTIVRYHIAVFSWRGAWGRISSACAHTGHRLWYALPLFPHPTLGHMPADSPARQAPFQRSAPSEPLHWLHDTSVNEPVRAPCPVGCQLRHEENDERQMSPEGKNAAAAPLSSQRSKLGGEMDVNRRANLFLLLPGRTELTFRADLWYSTSSVHTTLHFQPEGRDRSLSR